MNAGAKVFDALRPRNFVARQVRKGESTAFAKKGRRLSEQTGVKLTLAEETHVSVLIRAGVDILTISRRLGHSKAAITLDVYGHLISGADKDAADAIAGVLK